MAKFHKTVFQKDREGGEQRNAPLNRHLLLCRKPMQHIWLKSPPASPLAPGACGDPPKAASPRVLCRDTQGASCRVPCAAQTPAKSLEKAELEPAFSPGITKASRQWECLASLRVPTGLKLPVLDICIYITVAELTVLGSTGAL